MLTLKCREQQEAIEKGKILNEGFAVEFYKLRNFCFKGYYAVLKVFCFEKAIKIVGLQLFHRVGNCEFPAAQPGHLLQTAGLEQSGGNHEHRHQLPEAVRPFPRCTLTLDRSFNSRKTSTTKSKPSKSTTTISGSSLEKTQISTSKPSQSIRATSLSFLI